MIIAAVSGIHPDVIEKSFLQTMVREHNADLQVSSGSFSFISFYTILGSPRLAK